ncbi:hypothetical protein LVJ94_09215 [Pendulispora rubella]|uniref:Glycosyltransferase RgtA/B/C/D-like domain-containing protein n=1 Tax=Pendulispora rubella TaxID=2741070 RepID=A0ABZ2L9G6_9BACT
MTSLSPRAAAGASILLTVAYAMALAVFKWVPRYDCITLMVVLVLVFHWLDRSPARTWLLHAITQVLVAAFVVHLWTLGYEGRNAVFGGILPWSDSHDFYDDALRLIYGGRFEVSSKRPLFTTIFSGLLKLSANNLRFALFACAAAGAWAIALSALEVWKTHGAKAAFVVYVILLFFERRWAGFVQTEHFGLPLGIIGFVLCWRANEARERDPRRAGRLVLVGIFSIALGLMARAGAFFVLPAIAIWAARTIVPVRGRLRFLALAAGAMFAALVVHTVVLRFVGSGATFSDYPAIAYGLIHGEDYTYLLHQHTELVPMSAAERVSASWNILLAEALAHPGLVVLGFLKSGLGLFASPFGMFSYVWTNPDDAALEDGAAVRAATAQDGLFGPLLLWQRTFGTYSLFNAAAMGLIGGAFVLAFIWSLYVVFVKERANPRLSLLRHAIVGIILSAPFTPPWITSGQQVATCTLSFMGAMPALALLGRRTHPTQDAPDTYGAGEGSRGIDRLAYVPAGVALALALVVVWIRLTTPYKPVCTNPAEHVLLPLSAASVEVTSTRDMVFRDKAIDDLRFSIRYLAKHNAELTDSVVPYLHAGTSYVSAFDACDSRVKILIDDAHRLDGMSSWASFSVKLLASPNVLLLTSSRY